MHNLQTIDIKKKRKKQNKRNKYTEQQGRENEGEEGAGIFRRFKSSIVCETLLAIIVTE